MIGRGFSERFFGDGAVGDVTMDRNAVDLDRDFGSRLVVDVENRDFTAGGPKNARRCRAKSGAAAGDDRRLSADVHDQLTSARCLATMICGGGGSTYTASTTLARCASTAR